LVVALAIVAGASATLGASPAAAQPVTTGSFAFSGDPGDWISGGQAYAYSTTTNDTLTVTSPEDRGFIGVSVRGANGDWWSLDLAAPRGQKLAPGAYPGATRYPFQAPTVPGLSLSGNGRGCNELTGSFAIQNLVWGPHGYVQTLDATFVQHCEGSPPAARGEVHITNPPPPTELGLGLSVATHGEASTLNGKATVHGTVTCTVPVTVTLTGLVTQVKNNRIIRGNYGTIVGCTPGAAVPWSATADPSGDRPFRRGKAEVKTNASAQDPVYKNPVSVDAVTVVTLRNTNHRA
jgi:hypothetical protein